MVLLRIAGALIERSSTRVNGSLRQPDVGEENLAVDLDCVATLKE
jgi:hypothetical protein